jgi:pimeloyl-ACP methyl ester carboxylesterase
MPVAAVNVIGDRPVAAEPVSGLVAALPQGAPVTVMIHGYRYAPGSRHDDPHATLFAPHGRGWSRRLGLAAGPGLAIGLGWDGTGSLRAASGRAARAGTALARLVAGLRAQGAPAVNLIGHSLGARVALAALPQLAAGDVGRIALLSAAEFRSQAETWLATPAGRAAEVLNVASRENDLFDLAWEWLVPGSGPALGARVAAPNVVTLQIDHPDHCDGLRRLGYPVAPRQRLVCHWSSYTRPGLFPLYRAFLHRPAALPLHALRAALDSDPAPRWSRFVPGGLPSGVLPAQ